MNTFLATLKFRLVSTLGYLVLKFLWSTYRIHVDEVSRRRLEQLAKPSIFAHWHDQILCSAPFMIKLLQPMGFRIAVMISPSADGDLATRIIVRLGLTVVRGSASRGGSKALRGLYRQVKKLGSSPVMLPDGPQGPAHKAKPGTVVLARITETPIVPLGFHCSSFWTLGSWDRMKLPKPFARIDVYCSTDFLVPQKRDPEELATQSDNLAHCLNEARSKARP